MATLYELTEEYRQLLEMMEDDSVDPEVLQDTLEGVDGEIEAKADNCARRLMGISCTNPCVPFVIVIMSDLNFVRKKIPAKRSCGSYQGGGR